MENIEAKFHFLRYSQFSTQEGRDLRLKDKPAVYAWYRNLQFGETLHSSDEFLERINSLLLAKLSHKFTGKLGYLYEVSVQESPGDIGAKKKELLNTISNSDTARAHLANILETATFLQAPLYIGKAVDLRNRISEHMSGATGLIDRLEKASIPIDACILRFRYIHDQEIEAILSSLDGLGLTLDESLDSVALLVEELLTRFSPSAFVRRPG